MSATVTVTDRCTGCSETSLDFSPSIFSQCKFVDVDAGYELFNSAFTVTNNDLGLGRIDITWEWAS